MSEDRDSSHDYHGRQELSSAEIPRSFSPSRAAGGQSPRPRAPGMPMRRETGSGVQNNTLHLSLNAPGSTRDRSPSPSATPFHQIEQEIGKNQKLIQQLRQRQEAANIQESKHETNLVSPEEKDAEILRLKEQLNTATTAADELRSLLREEMQKNWELQYDLQDAEEEVRALREQLMNSIPVRFQGGSGVDDDDDGNTVGAAMLDGLPWEKYESSRIRDLKEELKRAKRDLATAGSLL